MDIEDIITKQKSLSSGTFNFCSPSSKVFFFFFLSLRHRGCIIFIDQLVWDILGSDVLCSVLQKEAYLVRVRPTIIVGIKICIKHAVRDCTGLDKCRGILIQQCGCSRKGSHPKI